MHTDKDTIFTTYNLVKERYTTATTKEDKRIRREQCFIIMHIMQNSHGNTQFQNLWEEYKATNDTALEQKWFSNN